MEHRPEDPNHAYYLTNCFVCNESTLPGETFIVGYGGRVCPSCRAFFRRANQNTRFQTFSCWAQSGCVITVETRRKCQKCRYDLCLKAGMNPGSFVNYFLNYFKKICIIQLGMEAKKTLNARCSKNTSY